MDKSSKAKNFLSQCCTIFILSNKSAVSQFNFAWLAAIRDNSNQQERDKERYISFNSTVDIHLPSTLYVNLLWILYLFWKICCLNFRTCLREEQGQDVNTRIWVSSFSFSILPEFYSPFLLWYRNKEREGKKNRVVEGGRGMKKRNKKYISANIP